MQKQLGPSDDVDRFEEIQYPKLVENFPKVDDSQDLAMIDEVIFCGFAALSTEFLADLCPAQYATPLDLIETGLQIRTLVFDSCIA